MLNISVIYFDDTDTIIRLNKINEIYDLKNPENVMELYSFKNEYTNLQENIFTFLKKKYFTRLQYLYLSNNNLINLPENIFNNFTQLQKLDLSYNNLTTLPENIFNNLTQLQYLYLNNNKLNNLPENIFTFSSKIYLSQLKNLNLSHNNLTNLPENIFNNLTQLKNLNLSHNNLTNLPENIFTFSSKIYLSQLQNLNLSFNKLNNLPEDIFNNLTQLFELLLHNNNLTNLPENIFNNLTQLQDLYLSNNNLTNLPLSIIRLNNLQYYSYENNELDITNPIIIRWYTRLLNRAKSKSSIYNNSQNVHNHDINDGIIKSINYLCSRDIKPNKDELIEKLLNNPKIEDRVKRLMTDYFEDDYVHSVTKVSLLDLFLMSFDIIIDKGIEDILNDAISSGECKCLTGIQNRYVNIFNGIVPECSFQLLDNTVFGALFTHLMKKYNSNKEKIKEDLLERGYDEEYFAEWLEAL
jgi:Leucine-rich repeat (LRR) protein